MRALVAVLLVSLAGAAAPGVSAADVRLRIDSGAYPLLRATIVTSAPAAIAPRLREGRSPAVGLTAVNLGAAKSVVVAIDRSRSMKGHPLADAVGAARGFVRAKVPSDRIAVVAFGSEAAQLTRFSRTAAEAETALKALRVDEREGTALDDAVALAAGVLADEPEGGRVVVLVTDGRDIGSAVSEQAALTTARSWGAVVYPIGIRGENFAPRALSRIANGSGGRAYVAPTAASLPSVYAAIADELRRTWRLHWVSAAQPGERVRVRVTVPGAGVAETMLDVDRAAGGSGSHATAGPSRIHRSVWGDLLVGAAVAALLVAAAARVRSYRRARHLRARLFPARADAGVEAEHIALRERVRGSGQKLFGATEAAFGNLRQWRALQRRLEQGDVPLRAVELIYMMLGSGLVTGLLTAMLGLSSLAVLAALAAGAFVPLGLVSRRARKRRRTFDEQLPELLLTLAGTLKAGQSFRQGLQALVDEGGEPASKEFRIVLGEARLGRSLDDALAEMAERVGSDNFAFVVNAVAIQRQVGGSLASLFDMVAETVRQRQQFAGRVRAITSQGRMSANLLLALPVFLAVGLSLLNPEYMSPLLHTSAGHKLLMAGAFMMLLGWLALKRIVSVRG